MYFPVLISVRFCKESITTSIPRKVCLIVCNYFWNSGSAMCLERRALNLPTTILELRMGRVSAIINPRQVSRGMQGGSTALLSIFI